MCVYALQGKSFTSADGKLTVTWDLNTTSAAIDFTLELQGTGWAAIGWYTAQGAFMADADMVVAFVVGGVAQAIDTYSPDTLQPRLDTSRGGTNDVSRVSGAVANGKVTYKFTRPLSPTDANDVPIVDAPMRCVYAYHPTQMGDGTTYPSHNPLQRGTGVCRCAAVICACTDLWLCFFVVVSYGQFLFWECNLSAGAQQHSRCEQCDRHGTL
jgi:hypothetical protein